MGFSPWVLPAPPWRGFDVTSNEVELDRHDPMLSLKKSAGGRRFSGVQFDVTLKGALGRPVQRAATPGDYTQMQSIAQTVPLLLTGFLGGATAAKVRIEDASACFSIAMGVLVWLGVLLRDARLRALLPLRR